MIGSRETALVIFYKKFARILQDVPKGDFGGLKVEERWRSGDERWMRV